MKLFKQGKSGSGGLMTGFLGASRTMANDGTNKPTLRRPEQLLSEEEIYGNLFVINFAGHDTTANTFAFSMLLLSIHREYQDWVAEELKAIAKTYGAQVKDWPYEEVYPKFKRCHAIMLETLRLYPPIPAIPKRTTRNMPQNLRVGDRTVTLVPGAQITPGPVHIHTNPNYWDEPLTWNPKRWIVTSEQQPKDNDTHVSFEEETLFRPRPGTYLPWSDGPQNCPGLKFSQVEYVAVISAMLLRHRLSVVPEAGENAEETKRRAIDTSKTCDYIMLLRLKDAERVKLRCDPVD
jgi:cytochrome P450